jgi:hypothetical protein
MVATRRNKDAVGSVQPPPFTRGAVYWCRRGTRLLFPPPRPRRRVPKKSRGVSPSTPAHPVLPGWHLLRARWFCPNSTEELPVPAASPCSVPNGYPGGDRPRPGSPNAAARRAVTGNRPPFPSPYNAYEARGNGGPSPSCCRKVAGVHCLYNALLASTPVYHA